MSSPNAEQIKGIVRAITPVIAGILTFWLSDANAAAVAAGVASIISAIWATLTHTEANAVKVVGAIAEEPDSLVRGVILRPTAAGVSLDKLTPPTVAVAGSTNARNMASVPLV